MNTNIRPRDIVIVAFFVLLSAAIASAQELHTNVTYLCDGERLLTIGGHLRRPSRTAHDGIPLAATMLLDDARTPFGVAPWLPWRRLCHHIDPALRVNGQKAEAQETTELLHARVVLPTAPPLGGADGEPDLVAGGCPINGPEAPVRA